MENKPDNANVWKFRLKDKIANISHVSLKEDVWFSPEHMKLWFYGYRTSKDYKASIWGKKTDFSFSIAPPGTPADKLPEAPPVRRKAAKLSPKRQACIDSLKLKIKELKARLPKLPDEEMENRYWDYLDRQSFMDSLQSAAAVWDNKESDIPVKCFETGKRLTGMLPMLKAMRLPDELMRDDTKFSIVLLRLLQFAKIVEENAGKNNISLPEGLRDLIDFIDDFTDRMIDGGNKLFGIERRITMDEHNAVMEMDGEAMFGNKPVEERLAMLQELWENRLLSPVDRIEYLEQAINLIRNQEHKRTEAEPCPHRELIKRHIAAIGIYMKELENDGERAWRMRMAKGLYGSLVSWREAAGEPPLTLEDFAGQIDLQSMHIKTKESGDGIVSCDMELYFRDRDDSFAGHIMYALVRNGAVKEITLMG